MNNMNNKLFFSGMLLISSVLIAAHSQESELSEASQPTTPTPRPAALQIPVQQVQVPFFTAQELGVVYPTDILPQQHPTRFPMTLEQTPPPAPRVEITDQENDRFAQNYQSIAMNLEYLVRHRQGTREQRIAQLHGVVQQALQYAQEVQNNGNAAYRTSGGFHHRFGLIVRDARASITRLADRTRDRATVQRSHGAERFLTHVNQRPSEDLAHLRAAMRNLLERARNNDRRED